MSAELEGSFCTLYIHHISIPALAGGTLWCGYVVYGYQVPLTFTRNYIIFSRQLGTRSPFLFPLAKVTNFCSGRITGRSAILESSMEAAALSKWELICDRAWQLEVSMNRSCTHHVVSFFITRDWAVNKDRRIVRLRWWVRDTTIAHSGISTRRSIDPTCWQRHISDSIFEGWGFFDWLLL